MELQERVLAERRRHRTEPRHKRELEAHHREAGKSERNREVGQVPVVEVVRADGREDDRGDDRPTYAITQNTARTATVIPRDTSNDPSRPRMMLGTR